MSGRERPNLALISRLVTEVDENKLEVTSNNLIFGSKWGDLIKCAPLALSEIGNCYVAASVPEASLIALSQQGGLQ